MTFNEQKEEWLAKHPNATTEEAFTAGYMTSTANWCKQER